MGSPKIFLVLFCFLVSFIGGLGAPLQERYGYITVRPGAHMFYILYENDAANNTGSWTDYPLLMWLQGGPGSSGVGYGNFWELGPYFINGTLRPWRWTLKGNLLFVDNPVGTGYSYVDDLSLLTTTNQQIADDLTEFTKQLYGLYPELEQMPFYVYSESYGGKMAADYVLTLDAEIAAGNIICDLEAVGLGDSWISPMDSVNTWGPFLYGVGYVNEKELDAINAQAAVTQSMVDQERWVEATEEWGTTEGVVIVQTGGVSFYNVFLTTQVYSASRTINHGKDLSGWSPQLKALYEHHAFPPYIDSYDELYDYMNGQQKEDWEVPDNVTWDGQGGDVFQYQAGDFMKPVIATVEALLETTNVFVNTYTGDWDLICDTPGTYNWVENMTWADKSGFMDADRVKMHVSAFEPQAGYYQRYNQFSLITFLRAGHMVPMDAPFLCHDMIDLVAEWSEEMKAKRKVEKKAKNVAGILETSEEVAEVRTSEKLDASEHDDEDLQEEIELLKQQIENYKKEEKARHVQQHVKQNLAKKESESPAKTVVEKPAKKEPEEHSSKVDTKIQKNQEIPVQHVQKMNHPKKTVHRTPQRSPTHSNHHQTAHHYLNKYKKS